MTMLDTTALKLVRVKDGLEIDPDVLQGTWTVEQYLKLADHTNRLLEFTDGFIAVLPMPTRKHQTILAFLYELLVAIIRPCDGVVFFAPLRVKRASGRFREPDLLLSGSRSCSCSLTSMIRATSMPSGWVPI